MKLDINTEPGPPDPDPDGCRLLGFAIVACILVYGGLAIYFIFR